MLAGLSASAAAGARKPAERMAFGLGWVLRGGRSWTLCCVFGPKTLGGGTDDWWVSSKAMPSPVRPVTRGKVGVVPEPERAGPHMNEEGAVLRTVRDDG